MFELLNTLKVNEVNLTCKQNHMFSWTSRWTTCINFLLP